MSKKKPERRISIRSVRREPPDYAKLGKALLMLAAAEAEAKAQAKADKRKTKKSDDTGEPEGSS